MYVCVCTGRRVIDACHCEKLSKKIEDYHTTGNWSRLGNVRSASQTESTVHCAVIDQLCPVMTDRFVRLPMCV